MICRSVLDTLSYCLQQQQPPLATSTSPSPPFPVPLTLYPPPPRRHTVYNSFDMVNRPRFNCGYGSGREVRVFTHAQTLHKIRYTPPPRIPRAAMRRLSLPLQCAVVPECVYLARSHCYSRNPPKTNYSLTIGEFIERIKSEAARESCLPRIICNNIIYAHYVLSYDFHRRRRRSAARDFRRRRLSRRYQQNIILSPRLVLNQLVNAISLPLRSAFTIIGYTV